MLKNPELLEEFYEENKDKYPNLSKEDMKDVVFGPWRFLKRSMEDGEFNTVRFKYFGTFQVYPKRAGFMLKKITSRFRLHKIDPKYYFKMKELLDKYIKKNEKED